MSRIFLSHSSANNAEAIAVRDWLIAQGWNDVFLDLDPERGLIAGQRWQAELKAAVDRWATWTPRTDHLPQYPGPIPELEGGV